MSLIPAATIASLSALDQSAMNETFTVTTVTKISDGAGSYTETTTTVNTPGYLWSASGDEAGTDQVKAQGRHRIAVPKALNVPATARMTQVATGRIYNIKYVFPVTNYSTSLIIGVEDV